MKKRIKEKKIVIGNEIEQKKNEIKNLIKKEK